MNLTFIHPWYMLFLFSIPILIFLHLYAIKFTKKRAIKFANFEAIKRVGVGVYGGHIFTRNTILFTLRMLTVFFLIIGASGVVFWYEGRGGAVDYVLAIDASGSMLATDFKPNRFVAAQESAIRFVDSLMPKNSIGILSFGGTTFIQDSISEDHNAARDAITNMGLAKSGGTAIGDAIIQSVNMFNEEEKSHVVILLSDGQSTVGTSVDVAIDYAVQKFVTVHTIGMATDEGATFKGIQAISKLDEETLNDVASKTGGNFYRASSSQELKEVYSSLASEESRNVPVPLTIPAILIAVSIVVIEWLLAALRYRILP